MTRPVPCQLYLITPLHFELEPFCDVLKQALDAGPVACLQLRLKEVPDADILRAAERLMPIAREREVAFLVNDRPDLAARIGADGVHVGQEDASYEDARAVVGPDKIVGVTCHDSRHLAMEAAEKGADYVAFGAFFPTATKNAKTRADVALLSWWSEICEVPCVAIGGIQVGNCRPLIEAGADFLAVSSGVWDHADGPAAAVDAFAKLMMPN